SLACANGNASLIDRLLKAGADPNATSEEGQTALMTAALNGKVDAVKVLLARGAQVNVQEPTRGQSALMWAASEGNTAAAETLIELGADIKAKSKGGFTPLLFAVRDGHSETVRALLTRGANANDAAPDGTSALNMAVLNAYYEIASVLLDHGANPNAPDARGTARNPPLITLGRHYLTYIGATPFYLAAHNGDAAYMRLLADHGADPKMPNVLGITPLIAAAGLDYWEGEAPGPFTGVSEAERLDAVTLALALGNDINAAADFGAYT